MTPSTSLPGEAMPQYEMHATGMEGVTEGTERMEVSMGPSPPINARCVQDGRRNGG